MPKVDALCISKEKGQRKRPVDSVIFRPDHGIEGDAHAGPWHRQVSLLSADDIETVRRSGLAEVSPGDFAENITTEGIELFSLIPGTKLSVGEEVMLEITQIGKECHTTGCAIFRQIGKCVMPKEGVFARVIRGGVVRTGDTIETA